MTMAAPPDQVADLQALADQVADAHAAAAPLRITGSGTWLDAGRPCAGVPVAMRAHRGIVAYVPGDLTLTARAGTSLHELDAVTAAHGQWLGLDPASAADGTIGATIATASDGPLSHQYGRVRDLVLGLACITGTGELVRAGGRVVKNVAGFDLVRLHTGAWGTLGIITEVTLRLRARPAVDRTLAIPLDDARPLETFLSPLGDLPLAPLALELLNGAAAVALGLPPVRTLLVRLGGNHARVQAQAQALAAIGTGVDVPHDVWTTLARSEPAAAYVARITHEPARLALTWEHITAHCAAHTGTTARLQARPARGLVRVVLPASDIAGVDEWVVITRAIAPPGAHVTWERLPACAWPHVPSPVRDRLSVGLRRAFDPARVLNRDLLGESGA
jgi:glycolate oxidase FAD binding subunit